MGLFKIYSRLGKAKSYASRGGNEASASAIGTMRWAAWFQIVLTLIRLGGTVASAIALPWVDWLSLMWFEGPPRVVLGDDGDFRSKFVPFFLAVAGVVGALISSIGFVMVEFLLRYNLDPKLGKVVYDSFFDEINALYNTELSGLHQLHLGGNTRSDSRRLLTAKANNTLHHAEASIEAQAWEIAARRFVSSEYYRFDTVFASDRFGSIFQYIHLHGHEGNSIWSPTGASEVKNFGDGA